MAAPNPAARPQSPPGEAQEAMPLPASATEDVQAQGLFRASLRPDWEHPFWGVFLGLLLVIADARLIPGDNGLTVGAKVVFCIAVAAVAAAAAWAWRVPVKGWMLAIGAVLVGAVAAGVSGDWFGGATEPPAWRDAIVPAAGVALAAIAAATWYAGRERGETLLVAAVTALGLVTYGQQAAPMWAAVVGVAATLLFLVPRVHAASRIIGVGMHALALLGLVQREPGWFTWTLYPFLTLVPVYLVAVWWRDAGRPRRFAWWSGAVAGAGMLLLGLSTLVGAWRKGLPVGESLVLLALGAGVAAVFAALLLVGRRDRFRRGLSAGAA